MLSMWLLFVLMFIKNLDIPLYFAEDSHFIGLDELVKRNLIPLAVFILIVFDIIIYKKIIAQMKDCPDLPVKILECKKINSKTIDVIISIIMPFVFVDLNKWNDIISIILLIVILGVIYIRTNNIYTNPTLTILGFNLYEVKIDTNAEKNIMVFTKDKLSVDSLISKTLINDGYYFAKEKKK